MEQYAWIFWIILGIIFIVAEIFTLGFVLLWFGLGALAAAFFSFLGFGFIWQFLIFAAVSITLTAFSRTIFNNYFTNKDSENIKTGVDSLPGQIGTVKQSSNGILNEGSVKVFGSIWTAFPEIGEEPLLEGEKVEVTRIQGSSIYVRKVNQLLDWREEKD